MKPCPHCRGLGRLRSGHRCFLCNATGYIKDTPLTDTKKLTMIPKKQSPLQELLARYEKFIANIQWHIDTNKPVGQEMNDCISKRTLYEGIVNDIKFLLPKEQQTFSDIWDAAKLHTDDYWMTPGMVKNNAADKTDFLKQYKPEA